MPLGHMVDTDPHLELRAQIDRLAIEMEALRLTLSALVEHFDSVYPDELARAKREYNPEAA